MPNPTIPPLTDPDPDPERPGSALPAEFPTGPQPQDSGEAPAPVFPGIAIRLTGRTLTCAVFALAGLLFYLSAHAARGIDLRSDNSLLRLSDVVRQHSAQNGRLQDQLTEEQARVDALARPPGQSPSDPAQLGVLQQAAGLWPLEGPGLAVTLDDAPPNATARIPGVPEPGVNDLVIHQQDIQAVVNALWRGGAEGVQVMDQRLIATSAVRCVGNTLLLQGRVYSPPYVIRAVGRTDGLRAALDADPSIHNYLEYVNAYGLGWKVQEGTDLNLPGYTGSVELRSANLR